MYKAKYESVQLPILKLRKEGRLTTGRLNACIYIYIYTYIYIYIYVHICSETRYCIGAVES